MVKIKQNGYNQTAEKMIKPSSVKLYAKKLDSNRTIVVIIFWNLTMFQFRSHSPQVKRNLISSITNLVFKWLINYQMNLNLPKSQISNLCGGIVLCPVSLPEIKLCQ